MDWDGLRVFLAVARTRRVSTAARQLRVEHTTVSRRLAALEHDIGAPLFHRTAAGYLLTAVGNDVLPIAEDIERGIAGIDTAARERTGRMSGRVRLALVPEFASHWLAPHLPAFRARYPDINLQILVGTRQRDLSRGEAELAVHGARPPQTGLVAVRLARSATAFYVAKTFPGARRLRITDAASIEEVPLLVYTDQYSPLQSAPWLQPALVAARVALESNSTHALLEAARAGLGAAVLPMFVGRRVPDLLQVSDVAAENDVWLVTHPEFRRDPRVRATADFLKSVATGSDGLE